MAFPTLASGSMKVQGALLAEALAKYPATVGQSFITRSVRFLGDQEQRWTVRRGMFSVTLEYQGLNGYDISVLRAFFNTARGAFVSSDLSSTFDITLAGQNYQYCAFDQDEFVAESDAGETFSTELRVRQIRPN